LTDLALVENVRYEVMNAGTTYAVTTVTTVVTLVICVMIVVTTVTTAVIVTIAQTAEGTDLEIVAQPDSMLDALCERSGDMAADGIPPSDQRTHLYHHTMQSGWKTCCDCFASGKRQQGVLGLGFD
jgi:hypothetical protein